MEIKKQSTFDAFQKKTGEQQTAQLKEAKKLVNLFRHLPFFGEGFVPLYNKMLLEADSEVQALFNGIVGGGEVSRYLSFIKNPIPQKKEKIEEIQEKSFLPSPDEIPPFKGLEEKIDENLINLVEKQNALIQQQNLILEKMGNLISEFKKET